MHSMITETDKMIIFSGVIFFNIVGQFGNFNLLYAHYTLKPMHTKYGILVTLLVLTQSICLSYELVGVVYGVSGYPIIRGRCFMIICPAIFSHCVHIALMTSISTDLLISIVYPLRHRSVSKYKYLTILVLPTMIYGLSVIILGAILTDTDEIPMCQHFISLPLPVKRYWGTATLFMNLTVLGEYGAAFGMIYCKWRDCKFDTNGEMERKAMKSLVELLMIFIYMKLIFNFTINMLNWSGWPKEQIERYQAYMIFSEITCYSSTFYLFFIRSAGYRHIFWGQICSLVSCCGIQLKRDRFDESSSSEGTTKPLKIPTTPAMKPKQSTSTLVEF